MKQTGKFWILGLLSSSISLACHSAPITFDDAWNLLLENNYSLKAQRANVESYEYQQSATDNLNLPQVSIGANYTRLDTDVTVSGQQLLDSTGAHITLPPLFNVTSTITERDIFSSRVSGENLSNHDSNDSSRRSKLKIHSNHNFDNL